MEAVSTVAARRLTWTISSIWWINRGILGELRKAPRGQAAVQGSENPVDAVHLPARAKVELPRRTPGRACGSSERMPFCRASLKVRPMAMTSPTDFISRCEECCPRRGIFRIATWEFSRRGASVGSKEQRRRFLRDVVGNFARHRSFPCTLDFSAACRFPRFYGASRESGWAAHGGRMASGCSLMMISSIYSLVRGSM